MDETLIEKPNLIQCNSCGKYFSIRAQSCPKCGVVKQENCKVCSQAIAINSESCLKCGDPNPFDVQLIDDEEDKENKNIDFEETHTLITSTPEQEKAQNTTIDYIEPGVYYENPKSIFKILFSLKGRIPRSTYWLYSIAYFFGVILFSLLLEDSDSPLVGALFLIFVLVAVISGLTVSIKRFHDRNKGGWYILVGLIPIIGPLWFLIELGCLKGNTGANRFGPDPLS